MATKRKQIVTVTEEVEICETKKLKFPIWQVHTDEQQVRWNKSREKFEFRWKSRDEWEEMEWENWLGDDGESTKAQVIDTLTNLLALVKATK